MLPSPSGLKFMSQKGERNSVTIESKPGIISSRELGNETWASSGCPGRATERGKGRTAPTQLTTDQAHAHFLTATPEHLGQGGSGPGFIWSGGG